MNETAKYEKARAAPGTVPVICTAYDCPYIYCKDHVQQHKGQQNEAIFSGLYSNCRKYIFWAFCLN